MKRFSLFVCLLMAGIIHMWSQNADLNLEMTVDNNLAEINQVVVFTIVLTNDGTHETTGITVRNTLPSGFEFVQAASDLGVFAPAGGVWTIGGLLVGASAQLRIQAKAIGVGEQTTLAEVMTSGVLDPDSIPGNGVDTDGDGIVMDDPGDEDDGDGQIVIVGGPESESSTATASTNCLAPAYVGSKFTSNPIDPVNSVFKFDYKIKAALNFEMNEEDFNTEYSKGDPNELLMEYYVNTADGSILLPGGEMGFFGLNFEFDDSLGTVDAAVWLANGQMVVYGFDAKANEYRAVTRQSAQSADGKWANDYMTMLQFFQSSQEWAAIPEPAPPSINSRFGNTVGYRGKLTESRTGLTNIWKLYFDTDPLVPECRNLLQLLRGCI